MIAVTEAFVDIYGDLVEELGGRRVRRVVVIAHYRVVESELEVGNGQCLRNDVSDGVENVNGLSGKVHNDGGRLLSWMEEGSVPSPVEHLREVDCYATSRGCGVVSEIRRIDVAGRTRRSLLPCIAGRKICRDEPCDAVAV